MATAELEIDRQSFVDSVIAGDEVASGHKVHGLSNKLSARFASVKQSASFPDRHGVERLQCGVGRGVVGKSLRPNHGLFVLYERNLDKVDQIHDVRAVGSDGRSVVEKFEQPDEAFSLPGSLGNVNLPEQFHRLVKTHEAGLVIRERRALGSKTALELKQLNVGGVVHVPQDEDVTLHQSKNVLLLGLILHQQHSVLCHRKDLGVFGVSHSSSRGLFVST